MKFVSNVIKRILFKGERSEFVIVLNVDQRHKIYSFMIMDLTGFAYFSVTTEHLKWTPIGKQFKEVFQL